MCVHVRVCCVYVVFVLCVCRTVRVRRRRGGCTYHGIVSLVIATYVVYMPHSPSKERESPHVGIMKEHDPPLSPSSISGRGLMAWGIGCCCGII